MKTLKLVIDPKSLIIAGLATALYYHVHTEIGQAISFAIAFMFSLDFATGFLKGIFFPSSVPEIRAVNMQDENLPPHIKEKVAELGAAMKEHLRKQTLDILEGTPKKCTDPHCKNCHPELN